MTELEPLGFIPSQSIQVGDYWLGPRDSYHWYEVPKVTGVKFLYSNGYLFGIGTIFSKDGTESLAMTSTDNVSDVKPIVNMFQSDEYIRGIRARGDETGFHWVEIVTNKSAYKTRDTAFGEQGEILTLSLGEFDRLISFSALFTKDTTGNTYSFEDRTDTKTNKEAKESLV